MPRVIGFSSYSPCNLKTRPLWESLALILPFAENDRRGAGAEYRRPWRGKSARYIIGCISVNSKFGDSLHTDTLMVIVDRGKIFGAPPSND